MKCSRCACERLEKDFLLKHPYCFHCMYDLKKVKENPIKTKKIYYCLICKNEIKKHKNLKTRRRIYYCSQECAKIGHKEKINNHWSKKVRDYFPQPHFFQSTKFSS
jgi:hypothetical protein